MLQCVAVCCSGLQCVAVGCSVLQCVAVGCSVLQCVAVSRSLMPYKFTITLTLETMYLVGMALLRIDRALLSANRGLF